MLLFSFSIDANSTSFSAGVSIVTHMVPSLSTRLLQSLFFLSAQTDSLEKGFWGKQEEMIRKNVGKGGCSVVQRGTS